MDENKEKDVKPEEVKAEEVKKVEVKAEKPENDKEENAKKEEPKKEVKFEKTTTTETKPNFFKAHLSIIITCAIIAVVAVAAIFIFMSGSKGGSPEKVFETYVDAMKEGSADKIMDITDVKGALAWNNCGRNASKFIDEYNSITNDEADKYKDTAKSSLDSAMSILKAFGGVEINLKDIEKPEDLGNNLYKVKGNITMKVLGMEQDQSITLVTYNGKYVGEMYD